MATPIKFKYRTSKEQLFDVIDEIIVMTGLKKKGAKKELGLMSIDIGKDHLLYLQLVEKEEDKTELSLAPGIPFMKSKEQSTLPISFLENFHEKLLEIINK